MPESNVGRWCLATVKWPPLTEKFLELRMPGEINPLAFLCLCSTGEQKDRRISRSVQKLIRKPLDNSSEVWDTTVRDRKSEEILALPQKYLEQLKCGKQNWNEDLVRSRTQVVSCQFMPHIICDKFSQVMHLGANDRAEQST